MCHWTPNAERRCVSRIEQTDGNRKINSITCLWYGIINAFNVYYFSVVNLLFVFLYGNTDRKERLVVVFIQSLLWTQKANNRQFWCIFLLYSICYQPETIYTFTKYMRTHTTSTYVTGNESEKMKQKEKQFSDFFFHKNIVFFEWDLIYNLFWLGN